MVVISRMHAVAGGLTAIAFFSSSLTLKAETAWRPLPLGSVEAYHASECTTPSTIYYTAATEWRTQLKRLSVIDTSASLFRDESRNSRDFQIELLELFSEAAKSRETNLAALAQAQAVLIFGIASVNKEQDIDRISAAINGIPPLYTDQVLPDGTNTDHLSTVVYPALQFIDMAYRLYPPGEARIIGSFFNAAIAHVEPKISRLLCEELGLRETLPADIAWNSLGFGLDVLVSRSPDFMNQVRMFPQLSANGDLNVNRFGHVDGGPWTSYSESLQRFRERSLTIEDFLFGEFSLFRGHFSIEYAGIISGQIDISDQLNVSPFQGIWQVATPRMPEQSRETHTSEQLQPTRPTVCDKCWEDGFHDMILYGALATGFGFGATRSWIGAFCLGGATVTFKLYDTMNNCRAPCYGVETTSANAPLESQTNQQPFGFVNHDWENSQRHIDESENGGPISPRIDDLQLPVIGTDQNGDQNPADGGSSVPDAGSTTPQLPEQPPVILKPPT